MHERVKEHDRVVRLSPAQPFLNTPIRPGIIRSGRRLSSWTETLTGTLVELKRLLAEDITITILTVTVELRFLKRGCLRSGNLETDRYHNGSLRKQFTPPPPNNANDALDRNLPTMSAVRDTPITNNHGGIKRSSQ